MNQSGEELDGELGHGLMIGLKEQNLDDVTDMSRILVINLMQDRHKIYIYNLKSPIIVSLYVCLYPKE